MILMISATFTGNIIKQYEDVLQSAVLLAAFIPMLMDTEVMLVPVLNSC